MIYICKDLPFQFTVCRLNIVIKLEYLIVISMKSYSERLFDMELGYQTYHSNHLGTYIFLVIYCLASSHLYLLFLIIKKKMCEKQIYRNTAPNLNPAPNNFGC